ncbi:MAG TPA: hypothetical protein VET65_08450 [Candidatus Limnocylindrales bacterium]|nr:hypothetical protein [Candidatus Limnocylindrales bacterium]
MRAILRMGLVFGVIGGAFEVALQVIAAYVAHESGTSTFTRYVSTAISFLIIGGAARHLARERGTTTPGWQVGGVIGAVTALIGSLGGRLIASASPVGQAALAHLSAPDRQLANDPGFVAAVLVAELGTMTLFGALIGWLAAWGAVRFGGPKGGTRGGPPNGRVR